MSRKRRTAAEEEAMLDKFDADDKRLFREMQLVVESRGERGEVRIAGQPWPRMPTEFLRDEGNVGLLFAMTLVANAVHKRIVRESLLWRVAGFHLDKDEGSGAVFIDLDLGEGLEHHHNLRNRALDFLFKGNRTHGVPDKEAVTSGDEEKFNRKLDWAVGTVLTFCDACERARRLGEEQGRAPDEQDLARFVGEAAQRWGVKNLGFRLTSGTRNRAEALERVERKEWIHEEEFR